MSIQRIEGPTLYVWSKKYGPVPLGAADINGPIVKYLQIGDEVLLEGEAYTVEKIEYEDPWTYFWVRDNWFRHTEIEVVE